MISPLIDFCFGQKGREHYFIIYFNPFVDDWQKGGEVFEYICMFQYACLFISLYQSLFHIGIYQERLFYVLLILVSRAWILVSRTYFVILFCWYQEILLKFLLLVSRAFIEIFIGIKNNYLKKHVYFKFIFSIGI